MFPKKSFRLWDPLMPWSDSTFHHGLPDIDILTPTSCYITVRQSFFSNLWLPDIDILTLTSCYITVWPLFFSLTSWHWHSDSDIRLYNRLTLFFLWPLTFRHWLSDSDIHLSDSLTWLFILWLLTVWHCISDWHHVFLLPIWISHSMKIISLTPWH